MMAKTECNERIYYCSICLKLLKSHLAITYHYIHRHYLKNLSQQKVWISNQIQLGKEFIVTEDGVRKAQFKCVECAKIFRFQSALRYHLETHLINDFNDDDGEVSENSS